MDSLVVDGLLVITGILIGFLWGSFSSAQRITFYEVGMLVATSGITLVLFLFILLILTLIRFG